MTPDLHDFILDILRSHNIVSLATVRDDGFPQATTVGYANDGLTLYVMASKDSQKVANIRRSPKVSATIDHDEADWRKIKGLSMGALAEVVTDRQEIEHAFDLLAKKFAEMAKGMDKGMLEEVAVIRVTPKVISAINYEKEFGHSDLVEV